MSFVESNPSLVSQSNRERDLEAAERLVARFSVLLGTKLRVTTGQKFATDGECLTLPINHTSPYEAVELLLAHLLFRSNTTAQRKFVSILVEQANRVARRSPSRATSLSGLRPILHLLISVLELHRVLSLWGALYPGSEAAIRTQLVEGTKKYLSTTPNLFSVLMASLGGHPVAEAWSPWATLFAQALEDVRQRSSDATLLCVRRLMMDLLRELAGPEGGTPEERRLDALRELQHRFGTLPPGPKELQLRVDRPLTVKESQMVTEAANAEITGPEIQASLDTSGRRALRLLAKLASPLDVSRIANPGTPDAEVRWRTVDCGYALKPPSVLIRKIRRALSASGQCSDRLLDSGLEIDTQAAIERITGANCPCFLDEVRAPPFMSSVILLDCSKSMILGERLPLAIRAAGVLHEALFFPGSRVETWTLQSEDGIADICCYNGSRLSTTGLPSAEGDTPLHVGLRLARGRLLEDIRATARSLVVITDGEPVFHDQAGRQVPDERLDAQVRREVEAARSRGISVKTLVIGHPEGGVASFDLSEVKARLLFGTQQSVKFVATIKTLEHALLTLAAGLG